MIGEDGSVEDKLLVGVDLLLDVEVIGHEWVPVVECVKLRGNTILVLELLIEEQLRVKLELEVVATQVLHIVFDDNFDGLT